MPKNILIFSDGTGQAGGLRPNQRLSYIHPYPDGNGRMARFLMNAMLASGRLSLDKHPR